MHKLTYLSKKFGMLPLQGTQEWLESRKSSFGGSEVSSVLGVNSYLSFEQLLQRKMGEETEVSNLDAVLWGKWMEPLAKRYVEEIEDVRIYDFGAIPSTQYPVAYSPDGLFVKDNKLILLEVKCPMRRSIHKIPIEYRIQVQTGMQILPVDECWFYQFRFRKSALWAKKGHDRMFHREPFKRIPDMDPIREYYFHWDAPTFTDMGNEPTLVSLYDAGAPKILPYPIREGKVLKSKLLEVRKEIIPRANLDLEVLWDKYATLI